MFESRFTNGVLDISVIEKNKEYVTEETKVYAYYPKRYADAIGKDHEERIICEADGYIITEYKLCKGNKIAEQPMG